MEVTTFSWAHVFVMLGFFWVGWLLGRERGHGEYKRKMELHNWIYHRDHPVDWSSRQGEER